MDFQTPCIKTKDSMFVSLHVSNSEWKQQQKKKYM